MISTEILQQQAYAAFDAGRLAEAAAAFAGLVEQLPEVAEWHYMLGLAAKYRQDWRLSLTHNLRAIELAAEFDEAAHWNAAIAATALADWPTARRLWTACGITLPAGAGEIVTDLGMAVVRLNPWHEGETVFVRRIDPVRARILNVPLPESGYAFGDVVLHDGAVSGYRQLDAEQLPVFNALQRCRASEQHSFTALIYCAQPQDWAALAQSVAAAGAVIEDWRANLRTLCRRCSYGLPHQHPEPVANGEPAWSPWRDAGLVVAEAALAATLLQTWAAGGAGRAVEWLEPILTQPPSPPDGVVWWLGEDDGHADE